MLTKQLEGAVDGTRGKSKKGEKNFKRHQTTSCGTTGTTGKYTTRWASKLHSAKN